MATSHRKAHNLTQFQVRAVAAGIIAITLALAAYAAAADYETVSGQAAKYHVALASLNPAGILGGLLGITIVDIALTWIGKPIWWLRLSARIFAVGVVAANASAGWPRPVGVGLRIAAPALFVILAEAVRVLLLASDDEAERERRRKADERIPRIRWVLDLRGTFAIWKRMRLWRVRSYAVAVDMEIRRLIAIEQLAARYGPRWQEKAPAHLVLRLTRGVRMDEALAMVEELTAPEPDRASPLIAPAVMAKRAPVRDSRPRKAGRRSTPQEVLSTELRAFQLLEEKPELRRPRMGAELARQLGIHPSYGGKLHRRLTAQNRAPGSGADQPGERSGIAPENRSAERS